MSDAIFISVILPTYNRKDSLIECLTSLEKQSYPLNFFEVIIVDDGSTDGTAAKVEEFCRGSQLSLKYFSQDHTGPGAARNRGVDESGGSIVAFIEDDVLAESDWLQNAVQEFLEGDVDGMEGVTVLPGLSSSVRVFDKDTHLSFIPCNLFLRKEAFLKTGGYDPSFFDAGTNLYFREDADLGFRLLSAGYRIKKSIAVIVRHPTPYSNAGDAIRHVRRFYFDALLYRKNPTYFRRFLEVKEFGPITIHRPFHYISLFYIFIFILIFILPFMVSMYTLPPLAIMLFMTIAGVRYRYERTLTQRWWILPRTLTYSVLPFYYLFWVVRGCKKFHSWSSLV